MYSAFLQTDFIIPAFSRIFGSSYFAVYSLLDPSSISTTASYAKVATWLLNNTVPFSLWIFNINSSISEISNNLLDDKSK